MDTLEYRKTIAIWLAVALLFSTVLAACGSVLPMGVETIPTTDATATVSAPATQEVATLAVPTPTPTPSLGKLAYVQGGDIWVKALRRSSGQALPDGESQRFTSDGGNGEPRWSPSGQWLAFRKGEHQVWLMSADGNSVRSLDEDATVGPFAWAPAAERLAYVANGELRAINADGTDPATLVPQSLPDRDPGQVGHITWSPDGAWIPYEWVEKPLDQPLTYEGLWKVSSNGRQRAELYASGAPEKGVALLAGWSFDGQSIFFWQGDILSASLLSDGPAFYSLPADGGEPIERVDSVLVHDDFVAPAPQGGCLAVAAGSGRATWTNKRVAVVKADGGALTWLTDESVTAFSPAWSPDGVHLAYVAMPDRGDLVGGEDARLGMMERRIWVINAQGKPQPQQLTDDPAYRDERPLWSADGSHLLFARMDAEGPASLWLIPAEGGDPRQVVDELGPWPSRDSDWFGYYGHMDWDQLFDWWFVPQGDY
jgi:Tol biopolymer transport system component